MTVTSVCGTKYGGRVYFTNAGSGSTVIPIVAIASASLQMAVKLRLDPGVIRTLGSAAGGCTFVMIGQDQVGSNVKFKFWVQTAQNAGFPTVLLFKEYSNGSAISFGQFSGSLLPPSGSDNTIIYVDWDQKTDNHTLEIRDWTGSFITGSVVNINDGNLTTTGTLPPGIVCINAQAANNPTTIVCGSLSSIAIYNVALSGTMRYSRPTLQDPGIVYLCELGGTKFYGSAASSASAQVSTASMVFANATTIQGGGWTSRGPS